MLTTEHLVNWDAVISSIIPQSGDPISMAAVLDKSSTIKQDSELYNSYQQIAETWKTAGYNLKNVKWYDYYPGQHFDRVIETTFEQLVNAKARRVWISEIAPGITAPYHWDVEDHEKQWLEEGDLVRYTCFIETPKDGHVFVLGHQHFYNPLQHSIIKWDHHRQYHAGSNCGFEPFYLFHFLGTPQ